MAWGKSAQMVPWPQMISSLVCISKWSYVKGKFCSKRHLVFFFLNNRHLVGFNLFVRTVHWKINWVREKWKRRNVGAFSRRLWHACSTSMLKDSCTGISLVTMCSLRKTKLRLETSALVSWVEVWFGFKLLLDNRSISGCQCFIFCFFSCM